MSLKVINVVIDDHGWPEMRCSVTVGGGVPVECTSLYDTALTNFQPRVNNALMYAVRDIIAARKDGSHAQEGSSSSEKRKG